MYYAGYSVSALQSKMSKKLSLFQVLTSMCAPDRLARSKQQLDRFAFARSVFLRFAILKLIKRRSSLDRSAESKFIPCGVNKVNCNMGKYMPWERNRF